MRTIAPIQLATALLAVLLLTGGGPAPKQRQGNLKVGDAAPEFSIKDVDGKKTIKLSELRGKPVVLIFGSCT